MRKNSRTGKRLRLIPLILGGYGAFLGFGLVSIGLAEIKEVIGMAGFGLLGIWDGVRDLVKPDKKPEQAPASQFILTDITGNRSSNVTVEVLQKQLESLAKSDRGSIFKLQILPPFAVQEIGNVSQIFCIYHEAAFRLTAFLDESKGGYESYHKSVEFDEAKDWFEKLLTGSVDFSRWKKWRMRLCGKNMTMRIRAARKRAPDGRKAASVQARVRTARKIQMRQQSRLSVLTNQTL